MRKCPTGPGFSIFPDETLRYLGADYGIAGDGEIAFIELLGRLGSGKDPSDIPGLHSRTASSPALHHGDLDGFPFWDDVLTASARSAGEDVWIRFLLLGGPGETRETVEESLAFAESLHLDSLRITVGIRIYPNTPLAMRAVDEGAVRATDDLLVPTFYLAPGLAPWIHERVNRDRLELPAGR